MLFVRCARDETTPEVVTLGDRSESRMLLPGPSVPAASTPGARSTDLPPRCVPLGAMLGAPAAPVYAAAPEVYVEAPAVYAAAPEVYAVAPEAYAAVPEV